MPTLRAEMRCTRYGTCLERRGMRHRWSGWDGITCPKGQYF